VAALDDLLARIQDVALRADLEREIAPLRGERELGLVFERHLPEKVRLPELTVRRGATVEVRDDLDSPVWQVRKVINGVAQLARNDVAGQVLTAERPANDLIVVREFGQPIYPGLRSVGRVERGGDKPFHTVINAENYHALETLLYTCEGTVDCIYIDPPYNTGARDWKYNNDYVDGNDGFRHSKWLSFMEKRLQFAKRLLNSESSALIVTIDEKEHYRLGLLLEQVFPGAIMQMVSSVINPAGTGRKNEFSRTNEFIYFLQFGDLVLSPMRPSDVSAVPVEWEPFRRRDLQSRRGTAKGGRAQFYPIFVDRDTGRISGTGEPLPHTQDRKTVTSREGCASVWPVREDGTEMNWSLTRMEFERRLANGYVRVGRHQPDGPQEYVISYLRTGPINDIQAGRAEVVGSNADGSVVARYMEGKARMPLTQWDLPPHDAQRYGTTLLQSFIPGRRFPFPKSLYAVEDTVRIAVADKPNAVVIDYFGGSGTTAHAVMRLNHQDGGSRRCILVTNNEIGPDSEKQLTDDGKGPGDPEWEALGIFEYITKPRIEAAVTGTLSSGVPIEGSYRFFDEFPMAEGFQENVEFFKISYEDPDRVQLGHAFAAVAPLLWMKAGSQGPRINELVPGWALPAGGRYGVLFDTDTWPGFCNVVREAEQVTHAFVVTDSDAVFQQVAIELPDTVTPVRLYESYLTSFAINTGVRS